MTKQNLTYLVYQGCDPIPKKFKKVEDAIARKNLLIDELKTTYGEKMTILYDEEDAFDGKIGDNIESILIEVRHK